ncbi:sigma-54 interaction domain-containing protein [Falsibacillus albus]|uniref:PAS domain S-box protein n=1 Tax=Falsibacillus albus TaxID=2478915 RepID=A0A3L7JWL0_9BACI|nr:sigma 54-interacting transcriptional regulator [Falsibacillus albus]RLQ95248.1 PAS domain S-box protein [Falsibacillus albus]
MNSDWQSIFQTIINQLDEGIHVVDLEGRTVLYNEAAANHDGMQVGELAGAHILEAFPSLTVDTSTLLHVIETGKTLKDVPQSYVNVHGKWIETVNTTFPLYHEGKMVGAAEIAKDFSKLRRMSEQLIELQDIAKQKRKNKEENSSIKYNFPDIKTIDPYLMKQIQLAKKSALSDSPVFVYGESGVGKELFVQSIHAASLRSQQPFIAQNCASLPESLLDSILFGTSKGSYTGAIDRPGLFEVASGGTLFLDELHAMPLELQAKLLRVLEEKEIRRIGSTKSIPVDVRIIAAMNLDPQMAMEKKQLRPDLFYRLNVFSFYLPPLRKRIKDIHLLTNHFIDHFNDLLKKRIEGLDPHLRMFFEEYPWNGNVRELKHTIEFMMNFVDVGKLSIEDLPPTMIHLSEQHPLPDQSMPSLKDYLVLKEKQFIEKALRKGKGNVSKAASLLSIPRQTLQYKIKKYSIADDNC